MNSEEIKVVNDALFDPVDDIELEQRAVNACTEYTRSVMREGVAVSERRKFLLDTLEAAVARNKEAVSGTTTGL